MSTRRPLRDVAAGYDAVAGTYDRRYDDRRSRRRAREIQRVMLDAVLGADRVLEVGVGTGRLLGRVAAPTRIGVDIAPAMLRIAAARGLEVVRADAHALPFANGWFDAVLAAGGVFRYLDLHPALMEMHRILRPSGRLAFHQFAARTWTLRGAPPPDPSVHEVAHVDEVRHAAASTGFVVEKITRWRSIRVFPYLAPIPSWLDHVSPRPLWSHVVFVLARR